MRKKPIVPEEEILLENTGYLTVKELRDMLEAFNDNTLVLVESWDAEVQGWIEVEIDYIAQRAGDSTLTIYPV